MLCDIPKSGGFSVTPHQTRSATHNGQGRRAHRIGLCLLVRHSLPPLSERALHPARLQRRRSHGRRRRVHLVHRPLHLLVLLRTHNTAIRHTQAHTTSSKWVYAWGIAPSRRRRTQGNKNKHPPAQLARCSARRGPRARAPRSTPAWPPPPPGMPHAAAARCIPAASCGERWVRSCERRIQTLLSKGSTRRCDQARQAIVPTMTPALISIVDTIDVAVRILDFSRT